MDLAGALTSLRMSSNFVEQVVAWERFPAQGAITAPFPLEIDPRIVKALKARGIESLYSHQQAAIEESLKGSHVVVATATASGKSLCYQIPVLNHLLNHPSARAMYLFPTKVLAHDQLAETAAVIAEGSLPEGVHRGVRYALERIQQRINGRVMADLVPYPCADSI